MRQAIKQKSVGVILADIRLKEGKKREERKICTSCKVEKSLKDFARSPGNFDGACAKCKECTNKDQRKRYQERFDFIKAF